MDSSPDAAIFPIGVFGVFDKAEPSRSAPPERRIADGRPRVVWRELKIPVCAMLWMPRAEVVTPGS